MIVQNEVKLQQSNAAQKCIIVSRYGAISEYWILKIPSEIAAI